MKCPRTLKGFLLGVLLLTLPAAVSHGTENLQSTRIGVLAKRGVDHCRAKWRPTAVYLSNLIPGHRFEIVPLDFASVQHAVADKTVDFILTNSSFHVEMEDTYSVDAIATLINRMHCGDHKVFGGVIFSRSADSNISKLEDLRGKDFMAVKETSLGGWRMAWRELKTAGINPLLDFKSLSFGGTHDAVVLAVRGGEIDAGTVRTDILERMAAEGKIDLAGFRILNVNAAAKDSLGIICSTRLYPEWPMAKLPHTSDKLAEQVARALFRMEENAPAAVAAKCAGWTYPLSYQPVHDCLEDLQLGPYDHRDRQNLGALYDQYKAWFISGGLTFLMLLITAVSVAKLNAKLSAINTDLLSEIDKRKRSESRVLESETRLQTIFDHSIAGVFIIDPETHTIVDANQSALDMVGADKTSVVGQTCHGSICNAPMGQCPITDLGETFKRTERTLLRADGTICTVLKTVTRFTQNGKALLLYSFLDVSELKETQFNLESALSAANDANTAKDQFMANMSHELRTPMNGIIGMTNILQNTELTNDQIEFAQIIMKSSEGLLAIINDILDYAHIASASPKLDATDFDLHALVDEVMAAITPTAFEKNLACTHVLDEGVPGFLRGDRRRLKKILQILMSNAVKFTAQGGVSLHITQGPDEGKKCLIGFKVTDTGIGIAADRIDHIFTPFSQVDYSSTRQYGGIGLGLALAKHFTEMMDGRINVESTPAMGTSFQVTLCMQQPTTIPVRKPRRIQNIGHHRILVVDDDPTNRQVMEGYLSSWHLPHAAVDSARTALAALHRAVAEKAPFEVAIIDHIMPDLDGVDLGRAIKEEPMFERIKMILYSSFDQACDTGEIRDVGFDAVLAKPVRSSRLFDCLALVCGRLGNDPKTDTTKRIITHASLSEARKSGPRILVVEDNVINQKVMLKILNHNGCRPDVAENGLEAVEALCHNAYDVVLMDIQMPVMNGFEATSAIRNPSNKCKDPRVPIIAVTANDMKDAEKNCRDAGMDDYLPKPVAPDLLMEKVRRWCDNARLEDEPGNGYCN